MTLTTTSSLLRLHCRSCCLRSTRMSQEMPNISQCLLSHRPTPTPLHSRNDCACQLHRSPAARAVLQVERCVYVGSTVPVRAFGKFFVRALLHFFSTLHFCRKRYCVWYSFKCFVVGIFLFLSRATSVFQQLEFASKFLLTRKILSHCSECMHEHVCISPIQPFVLSKHCGKLRYYNSAADEQWRAIFDLLLWLDSDCA